MIGMNDPAGMMIAFANAMNRYSEHTARVISYRTMYSHELEYDIEIPRIGEDWGEVEWILKNTDIFHFHMLLDESYQLGPFHLKDFVKNAACLYHHHGTYDHQCFLGQSAEYRERYERTGKQVLVSTPDLLEYLPMARWQPNLVPLRDHGFLPRRDHFRADVPFRVVQAPTRQWHKNTEEFRSVCDELALDFDGFTYEILQGLSFRECLAQKRSAHASFDHMQGWFGIASLESLAQGIPTIAGLSDEVTRHIQRFTQGDELPWLRAQNADELKEVLRELYFDREKALEIGDRSRAFMEETWTEKQVLAPLLESYNLL
jgi:hypothetical protein